MTSATEQPLYFDTRAMRRLVALDPLLAYTVVRHQTDSEEHWLRLLFDLEVRSDPALRSRYCLFLDEHLPQSGRSCMISARPAWR